MSSQAPSQQCPLTQSAQQRWEKMDTLSHPWSLSENLQPLEFFLLSLCPAPLSRTGASATWSGCPRCLDKKVFKTGRMSFNILSPYAKQGPQNSPGPGLLQGRGDPTDGVSLLTSRLLCSFLGLGELHLAVKMNTYRLVIMPESPAEPGSNWWAHSGWRTGRAVWCGVNRSVCAVALTGLLQAQRRPQQAR